MQHETSLVRKTSLLQKAWFMWFSLIVFPPLGIILMWRQRRFSKGKRIIASIIATVYFAIPIIREITVDEPLYYNHDELVTAFNKEVKELQLPYSLKNSKLDDETITSKLNDEITLIENIDGKGHIHEIIMVGQGDGTEAILSMGLLIGMTNPDLTKKEVGQVLKELKLFDESYNYKQNETTANKDSIRYNMKYDQSAGVIFSVSKID